MEHPVDSIIKNREEIEKIIRSAGQFMKSHPPQIKEVHRKEGLTNFVTDEDVQIQKKLMEELKNLFLCCNFYGEEDTQGNDKDGRKGLCFFIDPIDGTTNFIFGYNHSCVSVGAGYDGQMIAGFVYDPYVELFYSAVRGYGTVLNGIKLQIRNSSLAEGIVSFGCARYNNEGDTDALFQIMKELYLGSLSVREGGSAALDICRVASGANVVYLELKLNPYDYAAASVIVEEAGGVISQVDGLPITMDRPCSILAGTQKATEEVRSICARYLRKK